MFAALSPLDLYFLLFSLFGELCFKSLLLGVKDLTIAVVS